MVKIFARLPPPTGFKISVAVQAFKLFAWLFLRLVSLGLEINFLFYLFDVICFVAVVFTIRISLLCLF